MSPALAGLRGIMPDADPPLAKTPAGIHRHKILDSRFRGNDRNADIIYAFVSISDFLGGYLNKMREDEAKELSHILKQVDFLAYLSFGDMEALSQSIYHCKFEKGHTIIRQDEEGDSFFFIAKGKVSVWKEEFGHKRMLIKNLGPGEYFGEMSLLTGAPRSATVTTDEPSEFFVLYKDDFRRILQRNPAIVDLISRTFSHRKLQLSLKGREITPESMSGKIKKFFGI